MNENVGTFKTRLTSMLGSKDERRIPGVEE